jgi:hypothetical protein
MGASAREQMEIAFENVKAALDSVGGSFDHVVKLNNYIVDIGIASRCRPVFAAAAAFITSPSFGPRRSELVALAIPFSPWQTACLLLARASWLWRSVHTFSLRCSPKAAARSCARRERNQLAGGADSRRSHDFCVGPRAPVRRRAAPTPRKSWGSIRSKVLLRATFSRRCIRTIESGSRLWCAASTQTPRLPAKRACHRTRASRQGAGSARRHGGQGHTSKQWLFRISLEGGRPQ